MIIVYEHFKRFAAYNSWANARLYDAATALTELELKRDIKAYFTSLHGTLNHVLVADMIWLYRLTGEGSCPTRLDDIIHEGFAELRKAREVLDEQISQFINSLNAQDFERILDYKNTRGEARSLSIVMILSHLFNHQTHHRGQASQLLRQLGVAEPPALDMLYFELPSA